MSKLICYLGADRLGKTTACKTYSDANWTHIHFSNGDYSELLTTSSSWVVADRGWIERSFYDKVRRDIVTPEPEVCEEIRLFEIELAKKYNSVELIMLYSPWNDIMVRRHLNEITELGITDVSTELDRRRIEHVEYYAHVLHTWKYSMFTREIRTV